MEKLGDDELGYILTRILNSRDRKSCSKVCKQWRRVEGLTRASLRLLESRLLRRFLPRYRNLRSLRAGGPVSDTDLSFVADNCASLQELCLNQDRSLFPLDNLEGKGSITFGDQGLCAIAVGCRNLRVVYLKRRKGVGDAGIACLVESAKFLSILDLSFCNKITDHALEAIGRCASSLQALFLCGCNSITDRGLVSLAAGPLRATLQKLDLYDCDRISDVGVLQLKMMTSLEDVNLADCGMNITDIGGVAIAEMRGLRRLNMSWLSNVSDETITHIAKQCMKLEVLDVTGCELVTGAGLRHFVGHNSLETLKAASSYLAAEDVQAVVLGCHSLKYFELDISLRGWIPSSVRERLLRLCSLNWR